MDDKNNMVDTVKELNKMGYQEDFRIVDNKLYCVKEDSYHDAIEFEVDFAYRFESSSSSEDTSVVYAITIPQKAAKGILLDVLDHFFSLPDTDVANKIRNTKPVLLSHEESSEELKFGYIPKVHKSKFNEDPDRYELRKGYPDFPACPFGQSFSMLGYDKELKRYVWLVTSVMKDERLETQNYRYME